ncbi:MAG: TonB-dependent siderophore receptor, partial [Rubrivivax sp.]
MTASRLDGFPCTLELARGLLARGLLAVACLSATTSGWAQGSPQTVTITGRTERAPAISGFGDQPLASTPLSAGTVQAEQLADSGASTLSALTRFDASVGDAYNAEGYWSSFTVRGYALDNRFNFRRDGLPINAETAIALGNLERIEWLKGASGIQAGTSAPGGLVNLVVKRPVAHLRRGTLGREQDGTFTAAVDWSERFGPGGGTGLRLNASAARIDPRVRDAQGRRHQLALAADLALAPGSRLEAEIETSGQRQPSVPGFSLLGPTVPDPARIDPRVNLNNQRWTQPVVFAGRTASLRWTQRLSADWQLAAHAMTQRLHTDDRTAFPYGVYTPDYDCPAWCDRYAPNGTFSFWEYVSNNERRTSDAAEVSVSGRLALGPVMHRLQASVLVSRYQGRFQDQIFDLAGTGRIDGSLQAAASAGYTDANTNRDERSTEWSLRDAVRLAPAWQLWAGLRHVQLDRRAERTSAASDGLRATRLEQSATTPWLALAHDLTPRSLVYASWGRGLEVEVAP